MTEAPDTLARREWRRRWLLRSAVALVFVVAVATVWVSNRFLTERFTESTRNRAEVRLALYSGNLMSALQRASVVPLLLSRDPALIGALNSSDYTQTTQRLISYLDEIGAASLMLLDEGGRVVAATDRNFLGAARGSEAYFVNAQRSPDTVFTTTRAESGAFNFSYSRRVEIEGELIGVIVVGVALRQFEQSWAGFSDAVMVTDSEGQIVLATESRWRGLTEEEALARRSATGAIQRAIQATADWSVVPVDAYVGGEAVMRQSTRIPFQGWRMTSFTTYASVREKVNGVLALEIMGFALLLAGGSFLVSRKALSRVSFFQRESLELRRLNAALQRAVAERERAEKHLQVAEQTVAQTSKLAVLGEMSASVSHELNQPLAAMKTYLAGARLLVQRKRHEEALASFHRIDDLIERMGAITRQLKSYARKGGTAFEPVDLRDCLSGALALMEPQLKTRNIRIERTVPPEPVLVLADRIRIEQVVVNLLKNAVDATDEVKRPSIELLLSAGDDAYLTVRDNGHGITDLEQLFEPFYTTKAPGDGTGLGLAISSGIIADLGGRLTARNSPDGGAVFEIEMPLWQNVKAAE
ncbi:two-component system, NtrC family, C4-dicarboxylate transport sensor histidine kinase DctB [Palleronia marisminoris]|uniref:C4-dicarboxylate transport sensor protein DctB n=1 Tax=Palleronia marisminoris TaxID=315423 RepID=A0A1Y5T9F0_9RHOB|nr:ATP-binding protein [Palleronia marisminoris]SFH24082.1 two-component system, NtrC family, C4-dicarboxylate transport sensor histidine kinase DctB [Palleronia marisminoris]SLN58657.1 C4-dicarboxylate transport sensor protein DctB [Palleronia marisminoris]